jgi:uncharacterized protein
MKITDSLLLIFFLILPFCSVAGQEADTNYVKAIQEWRTGREKRLKAPDGWLSLAGLFTLKPGENTFGSSKETDMVFPAKAPEFMGSLYLEDTMVFVSAPEGVDILINDSLPAAPDMKTLVYHPPAMMSHETLNWFVIERGGRYMIRLRDAESETIRSFSGLDYYPIDEKWKVKASFQPYEKTRELLVRNVLDMDVAVRSEGVLHFELDGKPMELIVLDEGGEDWFLIFTDATTGEETYPAGRYLYVPKAGADGLTYIDFNKAYNPPCAFTDYATCLLPPAGNEIDAAVRAGEKRYH